jgi:hypothetical protein
MTTSKAASDPRNPLRPEGLAKGLGWFSIALGVGELVAPRAIARFLGAKDRAWLVRLYGLREIGNGMAVLAQHKPVPWIWARVAGDALDIATLVTLLSPDNRKRDQAAGAAGAVLGVTALDVICLRGLSRK